MDNCSFLTKITQTVRADVYNLADQKNEDSPTFLIDRTVCNYNENPVQIYTFERKIKRDEILLDDKKIEYTLTGMFTTSIICFEQKPFVAQKLTMIS